MHYRSQRESFVIQVRGSTETLNQGTPKLNFTAMKLFTRFRKILMRLIFSGTSSMATTARQKNCDRFDPPKTSCSSYYSSHSHYSEAIADCIEFFNKSAHDGILDGRKSDVLV
ncbi:WEB family protein [Hibiscus syriacus]|uniref:WEB family protein n=1 Tax=Hibiscus syriacus TaxID=106335 RepID=A0A6A3BFI5_HIBSY|nr:WEB family protein [Hibiscus syriacus]